MKLNPEQKTWLAGAQQEFLTRLKPASSPLGSHLFDVAERIPEDALRTARIFGSRAAALEVLPSGGTVAEVGTQAGHFAQRILDELKPDRLHLFDLEFETLRSSNPAIASDNRVTLHQGDSSTALAELPDQIFDWMYIDGDHKIEGVRRDRDVAVLKLKPDGIMVFNDYTVWSPMEMTDYGVVPIVNAMLASGEWEVLYLALHPLMYCDIAIRRRHR